MAIEFQHISKRFADTRALEDVSLTFEEGKIYGLLGNNGAGKSTLLNHLTGAGIPANNRLFDTLDTTSRLLTVSDTLDVVVTHPGACCGPYDFKVSSVGEMVRMYMRGKFPVSLAFGMYNFVDVRDVAKGMHSAAEKGRPGECYILTSEAVTVDQLLHILAEKTGIPASKFKLPLWLAQAAAPLMEVYYKAAHKTPLFTRYSLRKLNSNCNFSIEKAERELDYHPMSARESFHDMVDWIAEHENIPLKK